MLKAGLSGIGYGGFYGLFLEHAFALERKINVPFSVLAQYRHGMTGWENSHLGLDVGVRWYYSLPGASGRERVLTTFRPTTFRFSLTICGQVGIRTFLGGNCKR